jgi:hypothetical protein
MERLKNRLLKFCAHNMLLFFSFLFAAAVYSTNEANKAGLKQSIFLDVYGCKRQKGSLTMFRNELW